MILWLCEVCHPWKPPTPSGSPRTPGDHRPLWEQSRRRCRQGAAAVEDVVHCGPLVVGSRQPCRDCASRSRALLSYVVWETLRGNPKAPLCQPLFQPLLSKNSHGIFTGSLFILILDRQFNVLLEQGGCGSNVMPPENGSPSVVLKKKKKKKITLEKEMATCSSVLAWKIPWTEEPGGLQSMGLQRVGCDLAYRHIL